MASVEKKIAEHIILAQVASDGGKDIDDIRNILGQKSRNAWDFGYQVKDSHIFAAVSLIARYHVRNFRYSVSYGDASGVSGSLLVYFSFHLNGKRYQVSFHSFNDNLVKYIKGSCPTSWDRKSSREACMALRRFYF